MMRKRPDTTPPREPREPLLPEDEGLGDVPPDVAAALAREFKYEDLIQAGRDALGSGSVEDARKWAVARDLLKASGRMGGAVKGADPAEQSIEAVLHEIQDLYNNPLLDPFFRPVAARSEARIAEMEASIRARMTQA